MYFILICSGIWSLIYSFVKWSLEARNLLLKILGMINGAYLLFLGIFRIFHPLNNNSILLSFFLLLILIGALLVFKFDVEKNTISLIAIFSSIALVIGAIILTLFSNRIDDNIYACIILAGCIMILSTPFDKLCVKK